MLLEAEYGKLTLNNPTKILAEGKKKPTPVREYIESQGRYAHMLKSPQKEEYLASIQEEILRELKFMSARAEL
jgi:pyruvate/2-oxoacid:ferredoxin oxidoreductase beta subunit